MKLSQSSERSEKSKRTNEDLRRYRDDIGHTDDARLCRNLDRLLAGDESARPEVENALDQVDADLRKYEGLRRNL